MSQEFSDIERATVEVLNRTAPYHLVLRAWIRQLTAELGYAGNLDDFPVTPELQQRCAALGYRWHGSGLRSLADYILDRDAYDLVVTANVPEQRGTRYAETMTTLAATFDATIYRLASALAFYRRQGRPAGTFPREVQQLVGPLTLQSTSLATALVDYADALAALVWDARDDWCYRH